MGENGQRCLDVLVETDTPRTLAIMQIAMCLMIPGLVSVCTKEEWSNTHVKEWQKSTKQQANKIANTNDDDCHQPGLLSII